MKKIVLLHDWLTGFRGGERVLEAFCELYPDAPLYTLIHVPHTTSPVIEKRKITASFLNSIPKIEKHYRKFLPLMPKAAEQLKIIENADIVLSSSHCVIKGVIKPKNSKHISYIHSPMRYFYDQYDVYFGPHAPYSQQVAAKIFKNYLTAWDLKSNSNVDVMIANSHFVKDRITNYYQRDSTVIHPFVDLGDFRPYQNGSLEKDNFYLMVTAFAPNKRVDLAIKAFNQLNKKLVIIGSGQNADFLKSIAGPSITFLGNVSRADVIKYLFKARALVFPGIEDFGITPLEALASGTPVIAYKKGGVLETLNENVAFFFEDATVDHLIEAVVSFEKISYDPKILFERAENFSKEKFKNEIRKIVEL
jgi:glycosyltransferase involved in cell wall biosynthesis